MNQTTSSLLRSRGAWITCCLLIGGIFWLWRSGHDETASQSGAEAAARTKPDSIEDGESRDSRLPSQPSLRKEGRSLDAALEEALRFSDARFRWEALKRLKEQLKALPQEQAVPWLLDLLNSGRDQNLNYPFIVGRDGFLGSWPTLRVYLLDVLGQISSAQSRIYADKIFSASRNPDEWAIGLRAVGQSFRKTHARHRASEKEYLTQKALEMLRRPEFKRNVSAGYLEAFDVVPFVLDPRLMAEMVDRLMLPSIEGKAAFVACTKSVLREGSLLADGSPNLVSASIPGTIRGQFLALLDPTKSNDWRILSKWLGETPPFEEQKALLTQIPRFNALENYSLFRTSFEFSPTINWRSRRLGWLALLRRWQEVATDQQVMELIAQAQVNTRSKSP